MMQPCMYVVRHHFVRAIYGTLKKPCRREAIYSKTAHHMHAYRREEASHDLN